MDPYRTPEQSLGRVVAQHTRARKNIAFLVTLAAVLVLATGGLTAGLIVAPPDDEGDLVGVVILGVILASFAGFAIYRLLSQRNLTVTVYEDGLVHTRGSSVTALRWSDVREFYAQVTKMYVNGIPAGTHHEYRLVGVSGQALRIDDSLREVSVVGDYIARKTYPLMYPAAIEQLQRGGAVSFGKYLVGPAGVSKGGDTLAWHELATFDSGGGYYALRKRGKWLPWANIRAGTLPNAHVFAALMSATLDAQKRAVAAGGP